MPVVLCDVRRLCVILSEDTERKCLNGKTISYHLFIIYWFKTLHFLWAFCKELVKLKEWTAGLVTQQGHVPQSWITNAETCPRPRAKLPDGSPGPCFVAGAGCQWAAPNLWRWRTTEGCKTLMRKAVWTLIPGGEAPEVWESCWEGQPAEAQLG